MKDFPESQMSIDAGRARKRSERWTPPVTTAAFERWYGMSKYTQTVYDTYWMRQIAWDAWSAAMAESQRHDTKS